MQIDYIFFFTLKDKIPVFLRPGIVYKFKCAGCTATYYGKTKRHFKVKMCECFGVSALTGRELKRTAILLANDIMYFVIIYLALTIFPY